MVVSFRKIYAKKINNVTYYQNDTKFLRHFARNVTYNIVSVVSIATLYLAKIDRITGNIDYLPLKVICDMKWLYSVSDTSE